MSRKRKASAENPAKTKEQPPGGKKSKLSKTAAKIASSCSNIDTEMDLVPQLRTTPRKTPKKVPSETKNSSNDLPKALGLVPKTPENPKRPKSGEKKNKRKAVQRNLLDDDGFLSPRKNKEVTPIKIRTSPGKSTYKISPKRMKSDSESRQSNEFIENQECVRTIPWKTPPKLTLNKIKSTRKLRDTRFGLDYTPEKVPKLFTAPDEISHVQHDRLSPEILPSRNATKSPASATRSVTNATKSPVTPKKSTLLVESPKSTTPSSQSATTPRKSRPEFNPRKSASPITSRKSPFTPRKTGTLFSPSKSAGTPRKSASPVMTTRSSVTLNTDLTPGKSRPPPTPGKSVTAVTPGKILSAATPKRNMSPGTPRKTVQSPMTPGKNLRLNRTPRKNLTVDSMPPLTPGKTVTFSSAVTPMKSLLPETEIGKNESPRTPGKFLQFGKSPQRGGKNIKMTKAPDLSDSSSKSLSSDESSSSSSTDTSTSFSESDDSSNDIVAQSDDIMEHSDDIVSKSDKNVTQLDDEVAQSDDVVAQPKIVTKSVDNVAHQIVASSNENVAHPSDSVTKADDVLPLSNDNALQPNDIVPQISDISTDADEETIETAKIGKDTSEVDKKMSTGAITSQDPHNEITSCSDDKMSPTKDKNEDADLIESQAKFTEHKKISKELSNQGEKDQMVHIDVQKLSASSPRKSNRLSKNSIGTKSPEIYDKVSLEMSQENLSPKSDQDKTSTKATIPMKATTSIKAITPIKVTTPIKSTPPIKATTPIKATIPIKATTPIKVINAIKSSEEGITKCPSISSLEEGEISSDDDSQRSPVKIVTPNKKPQNVTKRQLKKVVSPIVKRLITKKLTSTPISKKSPLKSVLRKSPPEVTRVTRTSKFSPAKVANAFMSPSKVALKSATEMAVVVPTSTPISSRNATKMTEIFDAKSDESFEMETEKSAKVVDDPMPLLRALEKSRKDSKISPKSSEKSKQVTKDQMASISTSGDKMAGNGKGALNSAKLAPKTSENLDDKMDDTELESKLAPKTSTNDPSPKRPLTKREKLRSKMSMISFSQTFSFLDQKPWDQMDD